MTKALVTGANGHVGSNLCRELLDRDYEVVAMVRPGADLRGLDGLDVELRRGDILDRESVDAAVEDVDTVFHVAAVYATTGHTVDEIMKPAVEGVTNVLRAAADAGIERLVYTSTTGAVGSLTAPGTPSDETRWHDDPKTTYFQAKTRAERIAWELAEELSLDVVAVNPTGILGQYDYRVTPSTKFVRMMLEGAMMTAAGGGNFVDARDVAIGHVLAYEKGRPGERYLLVSDENVEMRKFAATFTELTGIKVPHGALPRAFIPFAIPATGALMRLLGKQDSLTVQEADEFVGRWAWFSCEKAKEELGYAPRPLRETLDHTVRWLLFADLVDEKVAAKLRNKFEPDPAWAN